MMQITVHTDGTVVGLYDETIDLAKIGDLHVERLTTIEFNNDRELWEVKNRKDEVVYCHASRKACLTWEQDEFATKELGQ